jgi:D-alanyl-D-alanine carboxypeptidase
MTLLLLIQALSLGPTVDSLAAAQNFSGVVLIARNGTAVLEKSYGMADREARRANNIETAFNVGSINKFFTQIAIRQLNLIGDSTLGHYWPDYPNAAVRRVTIRQLLEHRSGIGGNIFAAPASGKRSDIRKLSDFLPLFVNEPMLFEPGSQQRYSNAGYLVLGLLVERVSGENYYDYVRKHIYQPAGMTRTAHFAVDSLPENTAIGYTNGERNVERGGVERGGVERSGVEKAALHRNTDLLPGRGSSAGGGYSMAHDLLRLLNALREAKIPGGPSLGFAIAGGAPGLNAVVETDLPGGYDVIVLANLDPPSAEQMGREVRGRIR